MRASTHLNNKNCLFLYFSFTRAYNITKRVFTQLSRLIYHPVFVAGTTLLVFIICVTLFLNSREIKSSAELLTQLKTQVAQKQQTFNQTKQKTEIAQTPLSQETIIRNELLLQKPGEYIVQMPDLPAPVAQIATYEVQLTPWAAWKQLLGLH